VTATTLANTPLELRDGPQQQQQTEGLQNQRPWLPHLPAALPFLRGQCRLPEPESGDNFLALHPVQQVEGSDETSQSSEKDEELDGREIQEKHLALMDPWRSKKRSEDDIFDRVASREACVAPAVAHGQSLQFSGMAVECPGILLPRAIIQSDLDLSA